MDSVHPQWGPTPHVCSPALALLPRGLIPVALHARHGQHALQALCTWGIPTLWVHLPNSLGSAVPQGVVSCLATVSQLCLGQPADLFTTQWAAVRPKPQIWGWGTLQSLSSALRYTLLEFSVHFYRAFQVGQG